MSFKQILSSNRKMLFLSLFLWAAVLGVPALPAQIITTVAGNGVAGYSGDGGAAGGAQLNNPFGVAVDGAGNLFIGDTWNHRIRRVDGVTGIITTVAGNGVEGFCCDGAPATSARLNSPFGVAVDSSGNLFISDFGNHRIRKVTPAP
jgi:DNA-binding beta-propeller fold protein YncE